MDAGAELTMKQSYAGGGRHASVVNGNFRAHIEEGAKLSHTYVQEFATGVRHADVISSAVKKSGKYDLNILTMGGSLSR
jgi:Fe-S cluster assembly scaffold protein SufB